MTDTDSCDIEATATELAEVLGIPNSAIAALSRADNTVTLTNAQARRLLVMARPLTPVEKLTAAYRLILDVKDNHPFNPYFALQMKAFTSDLGKVRALLCGFAPEHLPK